MDSVTNPVKQGQRQAVQPNMRAQPVVTIRPTSARSLLTDLREVISNGELLSILALREIQVRYKQSVVGILWVIIQPILTTAIFTFVFSVLARIPSDDVPYPVFVFSGLLIWQYFSRVLSDAANSLVANSNLITKVFFPRLLLPLVPVLSAAVDFCLALLVLVALMLLYGLTIPPTIFLVPFIVMLAGLLAYATGLCLAPLNAIYRDIGFALPFFVQIAMYLSPVIYPVSFVPERYQWLYVFNPIATILDSMRAAVLGLPLPSGEAYSFLVGTIVVLLILGLKVFRTLEKSIVDRI